jgi:hypothetical protein
MNLTPASVQQQQRDRERQRQATDPAQAPSPSHVSRDGVELTPASAGQQQHDRNSQRQATDAARLSQCISLRQCSPLQIIIKDQKEVTVGHSTPPTSRAVYCAYALVSTIGTDAPPTSTCGHQRHHHPLCNQHHSLPRNGTM